MRVTAFLFRTGVLLTALVAAVTATGGVAAASHPEFLQRFFVTADQCWLGYTEGQLSFRSVHPPEPVVVDVRGTVYDRFRYEGSGCVSICAPEVCDDGRFTVAFFTAYAGRTIVDREVRSVDNGASTFNFVLGNGLSPTNQPIERVVVQVCRYRSPSAEQPGDYCGEPQEFTQFP